MKHLQAWGFFRLTRWAMATSALCLLGLAVVGSRNTALEARRALRSATVTAVTTPVAHIPQTQTATPVRFVGAPAPAPVKLGASSPAIRARLLRSHGGIPLSFEPNRGQAGQEVKFLSRGRGYMLFLTSREAVLLLRRGGAKRPAGSVVRMELVGADPRDRIFGVGEVTGRSNYFVGNDPSAWRTDIPNYTKVKYEQAYPGVDLLYYGNHGQLECDFVVEPGADPAAIRLKIEGARSIRIDDRGDLELSIAGGEVRFRRPQLYQQVGGTLDRVSGKYVMRNAREVGFEVPAYDRTRPLVIDPVLVYSTYLGGAANSLAEAVAADSLGNAYLTGETLATNFPVNNAIQPFLSNSSDAFVTKIDPTGSQLVYSTYLGGTLADNGTSIAVDPAGNAYITGSTLSTNFPLANEFQGVCKGCQAGQSNVFVAKINAAGSALVYSTYLGGTQGNAPGGIAADSSGNAYVTGTTSSIDFPTANPIQLALKGSSDAFVTKINPTGSQNGLVYSTYLGGTQADAGQAIAVDSSGSAYVTGTTGSMDFPIVTPAFQATCRSCTTGQSPFVTKINAAGSSVVYSTFLSGTGGKDATQNIAVDSSGNAYVTGHVESTDFPTAGGAAGPLQSILRGKSDAFVTKLDGSGSSLIYSTYLGGTGGENLVRGSIAVDQFGNAYITGDTNSPDFPLTNQLQQSLLGASDAFVAMLNSTGSALFFSTYLGGTGSDEGRSIAVDTSGNSYVAGSTNSFNFPTSAGAFQSACNGCGPTLSDGFLTKLSVPSFSIGPAAGSSTSETVTAGNPATYNLLVVPGGGFSGAITLSCGGTVPAGSCSASPTTLMLSGSSLAFTVMVTTKAHSLVAPSPQSNRPWIPASGLLPLLCWLSLGTLLLASAATSRRTRLPIAVLILVVSLSISCSSGSSSPPTSQGTPAGTYTLTITATSGAFVNSSPLTLTVN